VAPKDEIATSGGGGTSSATGMVPRSIRKDPETNERILALLQEVGEFLYGVTQISDLDREQLGNWVKRSHEFAKVQGDFSSLLALLEQMFEEARKDDKRLLEAELEDLEDRFILDARLASKNQERKEEREAEERERDRALFDARLSDEKQSTEERAALLAQGLKERETTRKLQRAQDLLLILVTAFFALLSGVLIVYGVVHGEIFFVGGSGVTATITLGGVAKLAVGWESAPARKDDDAPT
jgi:flagellar biosynthesis GTPase FlhF